MTARRPVICATAALLVAVSILLSWPAGSWLRGRDRRPGAQEMPGAVYLVCGARDQDRRLEALFGYLAELNEGDAGRDLPPVLVGADILQSRWSTDEGRNLTMSEWAIRKIAAESDRIGQGQGGLRAAIVPGSFYGTYGEMQALARYLRERPEIDTVVLATSPCHVRRCLLDLETACGPELRVQALAATGGWRDRTPWRVGVELLKILRDRLGWSQAALVSRRSQVGVAHSLGLTVDRLQLAALLLLCLLGITARAILRNRPN